MASLQSYTREEPPLNVDPRLRRALNDDAAHRLYDIPHVSVLGSVDCSFSAAADRHGIIIAGEFHRRTLRVLKLSPQAFEDVGGQIPLRMEFRGLGGLYCVATASMPHAQASTLDVQVYAALNSSSSSARNGEVRRLDIKNEIEETVVQGLQGPRQMMLDSLGRLWIADEAADAISCWDPASGKHQVVLSAISGVDFPQGVAVSLAGDIYWSEYGTFHSDGTALLPGCVKVRRAATGAVTTLQEGFWRCRGIALDEIRRALFVVCEANAWEQGNSGSISRIDLVTSRTYCIVEGLDFPQSPAICNMESQLGSASIVVPLARHGVVVSVSLDAINFTVSPLIDCPSILIGVVGGTWHANLEHATLVSPRSAASGATSKTPYSLRMLISGCSAFDGRGRGLIFSGPLHFTRPSGNPDSRRAQSAQTANKEHSPPVDEARHVTRRKQALQSANKGHVKSVDGARPGSRRKKAANKIASKELSHTTDDVVSAVAPSHTCSLLVWLRIPQEFFPELSRDELPYGSPHWPMPGRFDMPRASLIPSPGIRCAFWTFPLHEHCGARWPVLSVANGDVQYPTAFRESPEAYLIFVRVSTLC